MRPEECVLQVPSGSYVKEEGSRLRVQAPDSDGGAVTYYDVPPICHTDRLGRGLQENPTPAEGSPAFPPINGWLDYVGWYPAKAMDAIQSYTATYTIPNPPTSNAGQTLYYFIGIQDNSAPTVSILQPVLTFGPPNSGWYVESWACCPQNISVHSSPVLNLKAGTTLAGSVVRKSPYVWEINSVYNGQNATLYPDVGGFNYNWFAATQEVYGVGNCNQFAKGAMTMTNMVLLDKQGGKLKPSWQFTGATQCGGSIKLINNSPFAVTIVHTGAGEGPVAIDNGNGNDEE